MSITNLEPMDFYFTQIILNPFNNVVNLNWDEFQEIGGPVNIVNES
jgi:hypothetical protein